MKKLAFETIYTAGVSATGLFAKRHVVRAVNRFVVKKEKEKKPDSPRTLNPSTRPPGVR